MEHKEDEVTTIYSTVPANLYKPIAFQPFLHKSVFTTLINFAFIVINHYLLLSSSPVAVDGIRPWKYEIKNEIISLYNKENNQKHCIQ